MTATTIGNYHVERLIGEGGMGKVYLAVHPAIGRKAAIKILTAGDAADPEIVSRFITEARAANAIRHPNIVDIYDSGVLEGGVPYITMEFLDGQALSEHIQGGPLAIADAIDIGCQVAEALVAAHAHDVVHRDLKPDNLFLIKDPRRLGKLQVKVLDFGIAKLQHQEPGQMHKTRTGSLLGTPLYMSPEQCMGNKDIDARTDIYSLGIILYEMVTGRRPFESDAVYPLMNMHVNERPRPPSQLRPDLPRDVEEIILQALAKKPGDRQESTGVLLSRLELSRGNTAASSEALARVSMATLRGVSLPSELRARTPAAMHASAREIRTLGDTAVSRPVTLAGNQPKSRSRLGLFALAAAVAVAVGIGSYAVRREPGKHADPPAAVSLPSQVPAPTRAAVEAPVVPVVAKPVAPPTTDGVEVVLESTPAGAQVYLGDVLVGTTPGRAHVPGSNSPVDFLFRHPGFAPERVRAMPSDGLAVRAVFSTEEPSPSKPRASGKRKTAHGVSTESSGDIKTER